MLLLLYNLFPYVLNELERCSRVMSAPGTLQAGLVHPETLIVDRVKALGRGNLHQTVIVRLDLIWLCLFSKHSLHFYRSKTDFFCNSTDLKKLKTQKPNT